MKVTEQELHRMLKAAQRAGRVVDIWREELDPDALQGVVLAVGGGLVLVHRLNPAISFDGYAVLRTGDITQFQPRPRNRSFYGRALKLRNDKPKLPRGIDLTGIGSAIASASKAFSLITLHREVKSPTTCSIGTIRSLAANSIVLRCLTPAARWDGDHPRYRLADITLLEFGGKYEDALALVARVRRPAI